MWHSPSFGSLRAVANACEMKGFWLTTSLLPQTVDGASVTAKSMIHACQAINTSDVVRYHYRLTSAGILIWVSPHGHYSRGSRRRTRKQSAMKGEIGASRETLRWFSEATKAARWCGLINNWNFASAPTQSSVDTNTGRLTFSARDRSIMLFSFPPFFLYFFLFSLDLGLAAVQLWHLPRSGYEYAISRFSRVTVPVRFACSSHKRIDVQYPTTKITPEEIDFPTQKIVPVLLRRLMHSWLLRYTSFTRGHAIAVCLAARSRCALRGARPDWSLITIN